MEGEGGGSAGMLILWRFSEGCSVEASQQALSSLQYQQRCVLHAAVSIK